MDPEVIEITPTVFQTPTRRARKQVIDLDKDEDSSDVILLGNKGKAIENSSDSCQPKGFSKSSVSGSHSIINLDFYDDQHVVDNFIDVDGYTIMQPYFDSVDIPAGVEAPGPWLADPSLGKQKMVNGSNSIYVKPASESSSSLQKTLGVLGHPDKMDLSSCWVHTQSTHSKNTAASQEVGSSAQNHQLYVKSSNLPWLWEKNESDDKPVASGFSTNNNYVNQFDPTIHPHGVRSSLWSYDTFPSVQNQFDPLIHPHGVRPSLWSYDTLPSVQILFDPIIHPHGVGPSLWSYDTLPHVQNQVGTSSLSYSGMPALKDTVNHPPAIVPFMPGWQGSLNAELNSNFTNYPTHPSFYDPFDVVHMPPEESADSPSGKDCGSNKESVDDDDILRKYNLFKQFDAVEGHSDHHYASMVSSLNMPSNKWVKRIHEEWKILENDLPDTIFVRVYESRMDLLRAVIVGADGTPYHDGLFFFDVFFPSCYPNVPPHVYYHSGGLRLNPNLYNCGKVCLSLLNTWSGNKNEMWIPSMSTMLQVLVSIQALILNQKPYFNEPGYANWNGTPHGEMESHKYNENTFIISLKTMVYTVRRPPKHFKDFVVGHFYKHAHGILAACKAYMDGAEVGCLVKGGVQNIHNGLNCCTPHFRTSVAWHVDHLIKEFKHIGAKDSEKFLTRAKGGVPGVDNNPKTGNTRFRS